MTSSSEISSSRASRVLIAALAAATFAAGFVSASVHAVDADGSKRAPAPAAQEAEKRELAVAESFAMDYPNVKFARVLASEIAELYEVVMGTNIVYYSPASHRVIAGDMFDPSGMNVTEEKRAILRTIHEAETAKLIDTLPLDKAIKIGSGKHIVIEFTDIDCPYCRKVEEFFKGREDITRYVFLTPIDQLHPQSAAKTKEVLCAKDPAQAYAAAMSGGFDKDSLKGCGGREREIETVLSGHRAAALTMGVEGTPVMWVNQRQVTGADIRKLEELLSTRATATPAFGILD